MSTMGGRARQGRGEGSEGSAKHSASRENTQASKARGHAVHAKTAGHAKRGKKEGETEWLEKQATYIVFCARSETIYQIMSHMARAP